MLSKSGYLKRDAGNAFLNTLIKTASVINSWNFVRMFTPHQVSHVRCHVSCVRCHVSRVRCHMSGVTCHSFFFFFGQIVEASRWRVCYQRGLPCLVPMTSDIHRVGPSTLLHIWPRTFLTIFISQVCLINVICQPFSLKKANIGVKRSALKKLEQE